MSWGATYQALSACRALEANWDSYQARRPCPQAIAAAEALCRGLEAAGFPPPLSVSPFPDGLMGLEWEDAQDETVWAIAAVDAQGWDFSCEDEQEHTSTFQALAAAMRWSA